MVESLDLGINLGTTGDKINELLLMAMTLQETVEKLNGLKDIKLDIFANSMNTLSNIKKDLTILSSEINKIKSSENSNTGKTVASKNYTDPKTVIDMRKEITDINIKLARLVEVVSTIRNMNISNNNKNNGSNDLQGNNTNEFKSLKSVLKDLAEELRKSNKGNNKSSSTNDTGGVNNHSKTGGGSKKKGYNLSDEFFRESGLNKIITDKATTTVMSESQMVSAITLALKNFIKEGTINDKSSLDNYIKKINTELFGTNDTKNYKLDREFRNSEKDIYLRKIKDYLYVSESERQAKNSNFSGKHIDSKMKELSSKSLNELQQTLDVMTKKYIESGKALDNFNGELTRAKHKVSQYEIDKNRYDKARVDFMNNKNPITSTVSGLHSLNYLFFNELNRIFNINKLMEFDRNVYAMSISGGLRNVSDIEYQRNEMLNKGVNSPIDTNEFVMNVREIIKTGRDYKDSVKMVSEASKIAIASFEDLSTATNIINNQFLALGMSTGGGRLERYSQKLYNAVDNTALDLQDIAGAGKQSNTVMNSLVEMASDKGTKNGISVDDYAEQLADLNLTYTGVLRQAGKTGEQAGTTIRNMFMKLTQLTNTGAKRLNEDLKKVSPELLSEIGFKNADEMMEKMKNDVYGVVNGLSKVYKQGELSFGTISKMFNDRHASAIATLLAKTDGNVEKLINTITTGKDLLQAQTLAMENWGNKVQRIQNNFQTILKSLGQSNVVGLGVGVGVNTVDKALGIISGGITSKNPLYNIGMNGILNSMTMSGALGMAKYGINNKALSNFEESFAYAQRFGNFDMAKQTAFDSMKKRVGMDIMSRGRLDNIDFATKSFKELTTSISKFSMEQMNSISNASDFMNVLKSTGEVATGFSGKMKMLGKSMSAIGLNPYILGFSVLLSTITFINNKIKEQNALFNQQEDYTNKFKSLSESIQNVDESIRNIFKRNISDNSFVREIDKILEKNKELQEQLRKTKEVQEDVYKTSYNIAQDKRNENRKRLDVNTSQFDLNAQRVNSEGIENVNLNNFTGGYINYLGNRDRTNHFLGANSVLIRAEDIGKYLKDFREKGKTDEGNRYKLNSDKQLESLNSKGIILKNDIANYTYDVDEYTKKISKPVKNTVNKFIDYAKNNKYSEEQTQEYFNQNLNEILSVENIENMFGVITEVEDSLDVKIQKIISLTKDVNGNGSNFDEIKNGIQQLKLGDNKKNLYIQNAFENAMSTVEQGKQEYIKRLNDIKDMLDSINNFGNDINRAIQDKINKTFKFKKFIREDDEIYKFDQKKYNEGIGADKQFIDSLNKSYISQVNNIDPSIYQIDPEIADTYIASLNSLHNQLIAIKEKGLQAKKEMISLQKQGLEGSEEYKTSEKIYNQSFEILNKQHEYEKALEKQMNMSVFNYKNMKDLAQQQLQYANQLAQVHHQVGVAFGNVGDKLQMQLEMANNQAKFLKSYGSMNLNIQTKMGNAMMGDNFSKLTGKSSLGEVSLSDVKKMTDMLNSSKVGKLGMEDFIDDNKTMKVKELKEMLGATTSILSERYTLEQGMLDIERQRKDVQIQLMQYYLNEHKLKTEFRESGDSKMISNLQRLTSIGRKASFGGSNYDSVAELQRITNLKLDSNSVKMRDQLDYARRQIMVAKENAQRQINAIRRLEGSNVSSDRKSDVVAKQNTATTNKTITQGVNDINRNLTNSMNTILEMMNSMPMVTGDSNSGVISNDIIMSSMDLTSRRETGKGVSVGASKNVSKDTGGSLSYGIYGVNNKSGSYRSFYNMFKSQFPELSASDSPSNWKMVAEKYGQAFINAQVEWKKKNFSTSVFGGSIENFVRTHTGLTNESDIKRAGVYLVDASTQYGGGGLISAVKSGKFKNKTNITDVLNAFLNDERTNVHGYFNKALGQGYATVKGLNNGFNMRYNYALNSSYNGANGLDVHVKDRKARESYSTKATTTGEIPVFKPNLTGNYETDLKKLKQYEQVKDLIKSKQDEDFIKELLNKMKNMEGLTLPDVIKQLQDWSNKKWEFFEGDNSVQKDIFQAIVDKLQSDFEVSSDTFDNMLQKYQEMLSDLNYTFSEMKNTVETTKRDWENSFKFLNNIGLSESFYNIDDKIGELQGKIQSFYDNLDISVNFDNKVKGVLNGLENLGIRVKGLDLNDTNDRASFLQSPRLMLGVYKELQGRLFDIAGKNYDDLRLDETAKANMTVEERENFANVMATEIAKRTQNSQDQFTDLNEFNNVVEQLKLLKDRIEKVNEVTKQQAEIFKNVNQYINNFSKDIISLSSDLFSNEKTRAIRLNLKENELLRKGVDTTTGYGKARLQDFNRQMLLEEYKENVATFRNLITLDPLTRNALKFQGYSDTQLDNLDLGNSGNIDRLIKELVDYRETTNQAKLEEMNKLIREYGINDKFRNLDWTDSKVREDIITEISKSGKGLNNEEMATLFDSFNSLANTTNNIDNTMDLLAKITGNQKSIAQETNEVFKQLYTKTLDLLSDTLFGTDTDYKGLGKEQYKQALDSFLSPLVDQYGGKISTSIKNLFTKDKNKGVGEIPVGQEQGFLSYTLNTSQEKLNNQSEIDKHIDEYLQSLSIGENNELLSSLENIDNLEVESFNIATENLENVSNNLEQATENLNATLKKSNDYIKKETKSIFQMAKDFDKFTLKDYENNINFSYEDNNKGKFNIYGYEKGENSLSYGYKKGNFIKVNGKTLTPNENNNTSKYPLTEVSGIDFRERKNFDYLKDSVLKRATELYNSKNSKTEKVREEKQEIHDKNSFMNNTITSAINGILVIDGIMKKQLHYKKQELEIYGKVLELNLQIAETTEERRRIEDEILANKLNQIDTEYNTNSSFLGGMFKGDTGFGLQGALSGATTGMSLGGGVGAIVGAGLGLVGGILGGASAKAQASQQKAMLIAQQKTARLMEDNTRYLKTMANVMSEQAKWVTKVGVNDSINRAVRTQISNTDVLGGTAIENRQVQRSKKKGGGLLGKKKWEEVETFTASYGLNDQMFGGKEFKNRTDLEYAYSVLARRLINEGRGNRRTLFSNNSLDNYINQRYLSSSQEVTGQQFIKYFTGQGTLRQDGILLDKSRDGEIDSIISQLKESTKTMGIQERVNTQALIKFYENIKAVLDKEGKTTKRIFGNYFGIDTEEVKDEKGNVTEYRRVDESKYASLYTQMASNFMQGTKDFDIGSTFLTGTLNAFIQNVSSSRQPVRAITDEFNKLADQIYDVVTRTGEFGNVTGSIKGLIDNMQRLRDTQKESEQFAIQLAMTWVNLGGKITDIVKDMNNGLSQTVDNIKTGLLGASMEDTINNFGSNLFSKLGESISKNIINQKYSNDVFNMNSLLTQAMETNSISDITRLSSQYKGLSAKIESDRERVSAIQRLFTANRDIDYVDESIQYQTGTSQSITNNITVNTDLNAGTVVADQNGIDLLAERLVPKLVEIFTDIGFRRN